MEKMKSIEDVDKKMLDRICRERAETFLALEATQSALANLVSMV